MIQLIPKKISPLAIISTLIAFLFSLPLIYIFLRLITEQSTLITIIYSTEIFKPLIRTVLLGVTVTVFSLLLGTSFAWLIARTNIAMKSILQILIPLPLAIPSFIIASTYVIAFRPSGKIYDFLTILKLDNIIAFEGFIGACVSLILITYPYIYLPTLARLSMLNTNAEENAKMLQQRDFSIFYKITWPQISNAAFAGSVLTFLYVISDFGVVQLLGYPNLATSIYANRLASPTTSFMLSFILAIVAISIIIIEKKYFSKKNTFFNAPGGLSKIINLGKYKYIFAMLTLIIISFALFIPVIILISWVYKASLFSNFGYTTLGSFSLMNELAEQYQTIVNTFIVAIITGLIATITMVPVAYYVQKNQNILSTVINGLITSMFAIPGLVIALAAVRFTLHISFFEFLYGTAPVLIFAYLITFGAQSLRSIYAGISVLDTNLEYLAKTLGASSWKNVTKIQLPLLLNPILAGFGLVILSTIKELPVTLLASPVGFKTLATDVWIDYDDGFLGAAAVSSLCLILVSLIFNFFLVIRTNKYKNVSS
ncbi:MAG: iron(III) transport system permease protein [Chloroflexi bacterium]|jgi:iron(III) transport system permease protein|nr:MAG: iron(III) transport system permease protein [Chloroflexota bacterium]|tara:strand:+ start:2329 stop:3951 length:1623 start_codon:yes stop_codon:yes gene_type:complete